MKHWWALTLVLFAGGCAQALPKVPVHAEPVAQGVRHAASSPQGGGFFVHPGNLCRQEGDLVSTSAAGASSGGSQDVLAVPGTARADTLFDDATPPDPVTLEDNQLLSSMGQTPPQNEGLTVKAKDEVHYDFPVVINQKVRYYIKFYSGPGKRVFARWLERSGRYLPMMRRIFAQEGLPKDLTYLALIESGFNDRAYSWAHAVGPWQFIDSTGRMMGLKNDWWRDERRDFGKSTRAAAVFLKNLQQQFHGDWYLAVASYNAGPGKLLQAIRRYGTRDFWKISRGNLLQDETKNYVPKLLAAIIIAKDPQKYGFCHLDYQKPFDYAEVTLPTATDLEVVARLCKVSYERIKELNPELKRWCTPPGVKNYRLRIPADTMQRFETAYAALPKDDRAHYKRHRVRPGDTLLALSKRYHIRVKDIIALNRIANPRALHIGQNLILPLKKGYTRLPVEELKDDYIRSHRATYTVHGGDSLWKIAQRFSVSERQLRVWNRLGWTNMIHPGQVLVVSARGATRHHSRAVHHRGPRRRIVYRVRAGDTLWDIGRRFNVRTGQIMAWNHLSRKSILQPGDRLTLLVAAGHRKHVHKVVYRVQPGDTLWGISRQFAIETQQIRDWNNLSRGDVLQPGDRLTLMVQDDHRG